MVLYARQDADFLPVHIPVLFVVLKLLGFWFQPTSVGCRNHSARCCGSHVASQGMESGLDLLGLFRHLIKHIPSHSSCVPQGQVQCLKWCQGWSHPRALWNRKVMGLDVHRGSSGYRGGTEAPSGWRQRTEVLQDGARLPELHKHKSSRRQTDAAKCSRGGCREWGGLAPAPRWLMPAASGVTGDQ